ncbi:MAG: 2-succinyl-5-enolpyruvyl-6-hydroxy-3-cyclohexene-1-carboxylic-acid synthase [Egibacteraceae bacterium]
MNPATALANVLVEELTGHGLTDACLAPGSRSAPLALAFYGHPGIRLHVRIDERSAAFVALGISKTAWRPAAVLCTSGTAAANFHPAVVEAHEARVPLLVLTADRPPELRGTGANQTIDQLKLYGDAVRWFCEVGAPELRDGARDYWRALAARAWAEATGVLGGPPGPVHLNVPFREPLLPEGVVARVRHACVTNPGHKHRPPAPADTDWLAALIDRTERGLLVAGDVDVETQPLLQLAEAAGWPVLAEPTSNLRAGPNAVSTCHHLLATAPFTDQHCPDVVLVVGKVGLSRSMLALLGCGAPQVLLDRDGAWLDPARATPRVIVGDPALTATEVTARIEPRTRSPWLDGWLDAEAKARHVLDTLLDATDDPSEPRTARDLAALAPDGALLVAASSMPIRDLNLAMRPRQGLRVIANRGASGIDGFTSTAVGAALAHDGPTFALAGDLSLLHDQNGLLIAASEPRPNLVLVVVNNDGGGIFSLLPHVGADEGFERLFGTPHGVDLARVAAVAGCGYQRLERATDLAAALEGPRGIHLVEVRTDRAANAELHARLQEAVSSAVS